MNHGLNFAERDSLKWLSSPQHSASGDYDTQPPTTNRLRQAQGELLGKGRRALCGNVESEKRSVLTFPNVLQRTIGKSHPRLRLSAPDTPAAIMLRARWSRPGRRGFRQKLLYPRPADLQGFERNDPGSVASKM